MYCLSSTIILQGFSNLAFFVRKSWQAEENKGVEFTWWLWKRFAGRLRAGKMFDEGHRFGRMEERGATKRNVNYPTLAQPNPQGSRPGRDRWGTRGKKQKQNQSLPHPSRVTPSAALV